MYATNSHSYTHLILALGIVKEPTVWGFITSKYYGIHYIGLPTYITRFAYRVGYSIYIFRIHAFDFRIPLRLNLHRDRNVSMARLHSGVRRHHPHCRHARASADSRKERAPVHVSV